MNLPKGWKDITIKSFVEAYDILHDVNYDIIDKNLRLMAALSDEPVAYFEALPLSRLKQAIAKVQFLNDLSSINSPLPLTFSIGKCIYDVTHHPAKLSSGQYIDLMNILSQCSTQKEINERMHDLLAVICIPRRYLFFKGKYNGAKHRETAEIFYHRLTMNIAYPIALFFCRFWAHLIPVIKISLELEMNEIQEMMNQELKTISYSDGTGS